MLREKPETGLGEEGYIMKDYTHLIDEEYIREVNALDPVAEKFANQQFGKASPKGSVKLKAEWAAKWSHRFHAEMQKLWRERG